MQCARNSGKVAKIRFQVIRLVAYFSLTGKASIKNLLDISTSGEFLHVLYAEDERETRQFLHQ